jgi:hypothetical protein
VSGLVLVSFAALLLPAREVASALAPHPKPTVLVTPSNGLRDGERVTVRLSGFPSGEKVFLSECARRREANSVGCGEELAAQTFGFTGVEGRAAMSFTVMAHAAIGPITRNGKPHRQLCGACVLVATDGVNADHPHLNRFGVAALSFRPAALPFTGLPIETLALLGAAALGMGLVVSATANRRP